MAVTTTNLGVITAYGDAVAAGYTGTKAEWQALMASYATVGQQAVDAKNDAVAAKNTAVSKATEATTAASTATTKANEASASAQSIEQSASQIAQNASDISELKEDLTQKSDTNDMLKAFPTDTASGSVASFADGANVPVKSLVVNIDPVQSGSGDPSPDNVRPISGHTQAVVTRTGVNIWDEEWEVGSIDSSTGEPSSSTTSIRSKNYTSILPNTSYYVAGLSSGILRQAFYDADKHFIGCGYWQGGTSNNPQTTPSNARYMKFWLTSTYGNTYNHDISINYPSTDHDYHEGHVQSITIALGQTVYGGTLDVLSGELVIDRAMVDMGTKDWVYRTDDAIVNVPYFNGNLLDRKPGSINFICSCYANTRGTRPSLVDKSCATYNSSNSTSICIADSAYTDGTAFKAAVTGQTLVYELATPITVTLTPNEVTALLGSNNIWADSGDSAVEYRADPTLYISRLTEPDADMIADSNITSGQYFMVGNTLYKATANIASGGAITPNVNCTRKSLSEALNELNA